MLQVSMLPSGLRVVTYKIDRQMSGVVVITGAGSRYETGQEIGSSHFLEHILMAGTKTYPSSIELRDAVESLGGSRNAHTGREHVTFEIDILKEHLDFALKTIAEQLQDSIFDEEEIEKQKSIIQGELLRNRTNQEKYISWKINELLWPDQPLGGDATLEEKNLPSMNKAALKKFLNDHYTTSNTVVCIAGEVDHSEYVKKISRWFDRVPLTTSPSFLPAQENHKKVVIFEPKGLKQTHLALAFYAPSRRDSDRLAARLLAMVLDRNIVTRLRYEGGLTYHISTGYNSYEDTGRFIVNGTFHPEKTKAALENLFKEIERVKKEGVKDDTLTRAKSRLKTLSIRAEENVASLVDEYALRTFFGYEPILIQDEVALIERITPEKVQQVAKKFLNEDFKMLVTGPKKELAELESLYGQSSQKVSN